MPRKAGLFYLTSPLLSNGDRVAHAFLTRQGGESAPPFAGLNLSRSSGDDPAAVQRNWERVRRAFLRDGEIFYTQHQVHGTSVQVLRRSDHPGGPRQAPATGERTADGMVTDIPGLFLVLKTADCVPVLFSDPEKGVVGAAHAGWRGVVHGVVARTIETMRDAFGCNPARLRGVLGPAIGPRCFSVGPEVSAAFLARWGMRPWMFPSDAGSPWRIDLKAALVAEMLEAGMARSHVDDLAHCTCCERDTFFSYRGEGPRSGRLANFIGLRVMDR